MSAVKNILLRITGFFTVNALTACNNGALKDVDVVGVTYKTNKDTSLHKPVADTLIFSIDTARGKSSNPALVNDTLLVRHHHTYDDQSSPAYYVAFCQDARGEQKEHQLLANHSLYHFKKEADYKIMKASLKEANLFYGLHRNSRFIIEQTPNIR